MKLELCQPVEMVTAAEGEAPSRTIMGLAVPWNTTAYASTGPVRFLPGSIPVDGPAPKLIRNHDLAEPIGIVTERVATDDGVLFSARISATGAGDEALTLAADGVLDAVSVGVDVLDHEFDGNVMVVKASRWRELSMVTFGAFDSAQIHQVAAEADPEPIDPDNQPETETETESEAPVTEATIPTNPIVVANAAPITTRPRVTAAEYVAAMVTGKPLPQVAAADNLLTDVPGLLPDELTGTIWDTQYAARPVCDAVGVRELPQFGEQFSRRYIDQHTLVGQQNNELDTLSSQPLVIAKQTFSKVTFGGYVQISSQSDLWSSPPLVQALINDMIRQYSRATETYVVGQMQTAASTANTTIADWTDADQVIAGLYDGAAEMFSNTGAMPTHMVVHSDVWADLGQAKTAAGDYVFPYLSPSNSAGQFSSGAVMMTGNPLGLSLVVSNDVSSGAGYLLYGPALEVYEDRSRTGGVRVENPATASSSVGLWGFLAAGMIASTGPGTSTYAISLV